MIIRPATYADVEAAAKIYDAARAFMKESGNPNQWNGIYPNGEDVLEGIADGTSYVCEEGGEVVASFYFKPEADDPTYHKIYEGEWLSDAPYGVIHRIAVAKQGQGIVGKCIDECFSRCHNLRIDTHRDNLPMQNALKKHGFVYCGIIHLENGDERIAFQKRK